MRNVLLRRRVLVCWLLLASLAGCDSGTPIRCPEAVIPPPGEAFTIPGFGTVTTLVSDSGLAGRPKLNGSGQVAATVFACDGVPAGDYGCPSFNRAILWEKGSITDLGTLGPECAAHDINTQGQVVGESDSADRVCVQSGADFWMKGGMTVAFVWEAGAMTNLGTLPGGSGSSATSINDVGQIVGSAVFPGTYGLLPVKRRARAMPPPEEELVPVLWELVDGRWQIRDLRDQGLTGQPNDINNRGEIIGEADGRAFIWSAGVVTDVGTLGGENSGAAAINDLGQVVGVADTPDFLDESESAQPVTHAFLWQSGEMTDLGTLGGDTSTARDINNHGQIVGTSETGDLRGSPESRYPIEHAFIWQDGKMTDLNALLPPGSGWGFLSAESINDEGQILGEAGHAFGPDESGIPQVSLGYVVITLAPEALQRIAGNAQP